MGSGLNTTFQTLLKPFPFQSSALLRLARSRGCPVYSRNGDSVGRVSIKVVLKTMQVMFSVPADCPRFQYGGSWKGGPCHGTSLKKTAFSGAQTGSHYSRGNNVLRLKP
jgi:hypothetical protein